jgi:uncharacterized protein YndB with AHSA1/START domain
MTRSDESGIVRVVQRFDAPAERVHDAFLDPSQAGRFLFATGTGQVVRCEIDARVGGAFLIVDRRHGEDVAHVGKYLELQRPGRIVFSLTVEKYRLRDDRVTIEITPLPQGCQVILTQQPGADGPTRPDGDRQGWQGILEVASQILVDEAPTCGIGVAQHAPIPAKIGQMFAGLAQTLELHRKLLNRDEANARKEDDVYRELAAGWKEIATRVGDLSARMAALRELPMGAHDESAWSDAHLRAFETFVKAQSGTVALLRAAAERDEVMLASMTRGG